MISSEVIMLFMFRQRERESMCCKYDYLIMKNVHKRSALNSDFEPGNKPVQFM